MFSMRFFKKLPMWLLAIITASFFCECVDNGDAVVPRRKAYPRIVTHDSVFAKIDNLPIYFEVNKNAKIEIDTVNTNLDIEKSTQWINVFYGKYNAMIYLTFTPIDKSSIDKVILNRTQRISLNIGDYPSEVLELTNANGFSSQIFTTVENRVTPIQFLSTDGMNWVVSGAVYFSGMGISDIDSVVPVINVMKRDVVHSLKTIGDDKAY